MTTRACARDEPPINSRRDFTGGARARARRLRNQLAVFPHPVCVDTVAAYSYLDSDVVSTLS